MRLKRLLEQSPAVRTVKLVSEPSGDPGDLTLSLHGAVGYVKVRDHDQRIKRLSPQQRQLFVFLRDCCAVFYNWEEARRNKGFPTDLIPCSDDTLKSQYNRLVSVFHPTSDYPLLRNGRRGFAFYSPEGH